MGKIEYPTTLAQRAYNLSQDLSEKFGSFRYTNVPELASKFAWEQKLDDKTIVKITPLSKEYGWTADKTTWRPVTNDTLPENKVRAKKVVWFMIKVWAELYTLTYNNAHKRQTWWSLKDEKNQRMLYEMPTSWRPIDMKNENEYAVYESILATFNAYENKHIDVVGASAWNVVKALD